MRNLLVALMVLIATVDSACLPVFVAAHARRPVTACTCRGECHCSHCRTHHAHEPAAPTRGFALDCSGCGGPVRTPALPGLVAPYDVPALVKLDEPVVQSPFFSSLVRQLAPVPARRTDPPPRSVA